MGRHLAANGFTLLIVVLVLVIGLLQWGREMYVGPGPHTEEAIVEIPAGSNLSRATDRLFEAGVIRNSTVFRIGARYAGRDEDLKLGIYRIPPAASMEEVLDIITSGTGSSARFQATYLINRRGVALRLRDLLGEEDFETKDVLEEAVADLDALIAENPSVAFRVGVSEGLTVREVLEGIAAIPSLEGDVGERPDEGMMAPDTYSIRRGGNRAELVQSMVSAQERRLQAAWEARDPEAPLETPLELLTLASIVEKETGVAEERGVVAAVFTNRLKRNMILQTDPTIIYGITRGQEVFDRPIRRSDINGVTEQRLHGEVLYNTYQIQGLPPGPIANPGRAAIEAAANPEESPYIFFVADGTGGHAFAETLAEHERNVARYRALQSDN